MTKAVIFDLDGTLLNTLGDLTAAVNHGLAACGLPARTEAQVRTFVGDGVKELIARACPADADEATKAAVLAAYLPYYAAHNMDLTAPYTGLLDLLTDLRQRGVKIAVVSNKHDPAVQTLCAHYFDGLLDLAVGGGNSRPLKPAPDSLLYAMAQLEVTPDEVWYVGDSVQDVMTARNAGVKCAAVTWGFQDVPRLAAEKPTCLVDTADQLLAAVCKN
jgi:phosphoglycolate phosphatase